MALILSHRIGLTDAYKTLTKIHKKKSISYITLTLSLFTLSFFGIFAIRPTLITGITLIKNVSDLKKLNISYEEKISSVIKAQTEYEKLRPDLDRIESAIPKRASFHQLASSLEEFAKRDNVAISQMQIDNSPLSQGVRVNGLQKFGFSMIAAGDYASLISFMQHITNWKRIATFQTLELSQEGSTGSGVLRLILKGHTYYES